MKRLWKKLFAAGCVLFLATVILINSHQSELATPSTQPSIAREDRLFFQQIHSLFRSAYVPETVRAVILAHAHRVSPEGVWPNANNTGDDRIVAQLNHRPYVAESVKEDVESRLKNILIMNGLSSFGVKGGQTEFLSQKCLVNACSLFGDISSAEKADLVIFSNTQRPRVARPPGQIWMMFNLEAPPASADWKQMDDAINWTATYRADSTVVAPYAKFVPHVNVEDQQRLDRNYARGKTKKVAWFVSNCRSSNGRETYVKELGKYIDVDIYGRCGTFKCPRGPDDEQRCFSKLNRDYKFYLAFENTNCRDYITEKLFFNGLEHDVIPIVMGAAPEDYRKVAPFHSYIHVEDFNSPKELAQFLHFLDKNDDLYNSYFAWKGTGQFINTRFWCRVCALLHDENRPKSRYKRLGDWWAGKNVCIGSRRWDSL